MRDAGATKRISVPGIAGMKESVVEFGTSRATISTGAVEVLSRLVDRRCRRRLCPEEVALPAARVIRKRSRFLLLLPLLISFLSLFLGHSTRVEWLEWWKGWL